MDLLPSPPHGSPAASANSPPLRKTSWPSIASDSRKILPTHTGAATCDPCLSRLSTPDLTTPDFLQVRHFCRIAKMGLKIFSSSPHIDFRQQYDLTPLNPTPYYLGSHTTTTASQVHRLALPDMATRSSRHPASTARFRAPASSLLPESQICRKIGEGTIAIDTDQKATPYPRWGCPGAACFSILSTTRTILPNSFTMRAIGRISPAAYRGCICRCDGDQVRK